MYTVYCIDVYSIDALGLAGQDVPEEAEGVVERLVVNVPIQIADLESAPRPPEIGIGAQNGL